MRCFVAPHFVCLVSFVAQADDPARPTPAWKRTFSREEQNQLEKLTNLQQRHFENKDLDKIGELNDEIADLFTRALGPTHWRTVEVRWVAETFKKVRALPVDQKAAIRAAESAYRAAGQLLSDEKYTEAEKSAAKARDTRERIFGRKHPETAFAYRQHAEVLAATPRGLKWEEAVKGFKTAEEIFNAVYGPNHPDTAYCAYAAGILLCEGEKLGEGIPLLRKSLTSRLDAYGEAHEHTLATAETLAAILESRGRFNETQDLRELGLRARLALFGDRSSKTAVGYLLLGKVRGEIGDWVDAERNTWTGVGILDATTPNSPEAASGYNNIASICSQQGRLIEAEQFLRRSLAIHAKVSQNSLSAAMARSNLAVNLADQWKARPGLPGAREKLNEAEKLLETVLAGWADIRSDSLISLTQARLVVLDSLANVVAARGDLVQAGKLHRAGLDLTITAFGVENLETARARRSLAANFAARGQLKAARKEFQEVLRVLRGNLGEYHSETAWVYSQLGGVAWRLDDPEAEELLKKAILGLEFSQLNVAASGADRSRLRNENTAPYALATFRASQGQALDAWNTIETALSPGLRDDLGLGGGRQVTEEERQREQDLRASYVSRLRLLADAGSQRDADIGRAVKDTDISAERWLEYSRKLSGRASKTAAERLREVQKQIPPDTAMLGWIGTEAGNREWEEQWAYILRSEGDPIWVRLPGSDGKRGWSESDKWLAAQAYWVLSADLRQHPETLDSKPGTPGDWQDPAGKLYHLLFHPLDKHLGATARLPAVRRLVVLPSLFLGALPVEVILAARPPNRPDFIVSYTPSATISTWLRGKRVGVAQPRLLVVGNPEPASAKAVPGGVRVTKVDSGSNAERSKILPGDVLVRYAGQPLIRPSDVVRAVQSGGRDGAEVIIRRGDKTLSVRVAEGRLGVMLAEIDPGSLAANARQVAGLEGSDFRPAFGIAVKTVGDMVPNSRILSGEKASPADLDKLVKDGTLEAASHIYFVCHGEQNNQDPFASAIVLSKGERMKAGIIRSRWRLNADVVAFGTCESGLGKLDLSEGFTGFVQATLLAGGRTVLSSQWQVGAEPTALVMIRFHQNVLGKRPGNKPQAPMPKDEALWEAKQWVRTLPDKERRQYFAGDPDVTPAGPAGLAPKLKLDEAIPYQHPRFWAGIVLVGDPG